MSDVKVTGRLPAPRAVRGALDHAARDATKAAAAAALPVVRDAAPGGLGGAMSVTMRQTQAGHVATVGPSPRKRYKGGASGAQVTRWVTRGTGVYRAGPGRKRPITSKRGVLGTMTLPGGIQVRSVKGQRPNPFMARAKDRADAAATRAVRSQAGHTADKLRRM
jgi:hypothetical protein